MLRKITLIGCLLLATNVFAANDLYCPTATVIANAQTDKAQTYPMTVDVQSPNGTWSTVELPGVWQSSGYYLNTDPVLELSVNNIDAPDKTRAMNLAQQALKLVDDKHVVQFADGELLFCAYPTFINSTINITIAHYPA